MAFPFSVRIRRCFITCGLASWTCNVSAFWIEDVVVLASRVIWNGYRWLKIMNVRGTMVPSLYTIASKLSQVGAQLNIWLGWVWGPWDLRVSPNFYPCFFFSTTVREGWRLQNWWIFGKVPNGLWPPCPSSFSENHIADFATKVRMFIMAGLLCIIWSYFP